jgi:hypothetical protein
MDPVVACILPIVRRSTRGNIFDFVWPDIALLIIAPQYAHRIHVVTIEWVAWSMMFGIYRFLLIMLPLSLPYSTDCILNRTLWIGHVNVLD